MEQSNLNLDRGLEISARIQADLHSLGIDYKHLVHEPTPTSADSAKVRDMDLSTGVKAIILIGKQTKNYYMCAVSAHLRINREALAAAIGEAVKLADPTEILIKFGLRVGGVPPCGNLFNIPTYFDQQVNTTNTVGFNCGLQTESILMQGQDLVTYVNPVLGNFAE
jgi:prolyl-tRNA editing enzyme YbaK/EbsC (Cys-tRNA(Pro) deacylase)